MKRNISCFTDCSITACNQIICDAAHQKGELRMRSILSFLFDVLEPFFSFKMTRRCRIRKKTNKQTKNPQCSNTRGQHWRTNFVEHELRGWHSYTFNTVIRWTRFMATKPSSYKLTLLLWDWTKSRLFMYKGIRAYCFINIQNLHQAVFYGIATTDFITVLCRLINCSTPKTAFYDNLLEKLLWSVKFYLNQYFSRTSFIKLFDKVLNYDEKF